jgi:GT2 family glycosyltransferase
MLPLLAMDARRWRDEQRGLREAVRRDRRTSDGRAPRLREADSSVGTSTVARTPASALASVIVVCWNSADVLGRCLDRLFAQDYVNREIIVVDDGSDDETLEVVRQASTRGELTLVRSRRNRGCPSGRNLGLRHAKGEVVAFIDADGFATPRWLGEVVKAFGDDPEIGGIASTVFFDDNPLVVNGAGGIVNRQGWAADLSMNESYEDARIASEALYPMGCGMALRREALERVGPFDDRMLNYYDDVDYGTRLWRAGYRVAVAPDAWIDHGSGAAGADSARKRLLCERHRMRVVLKHASAHTLGRWAAWEARSLRAASIPVRAQKLRSIGWNARHLPSVLASRWRLRRADRVPERLVDASWGDGFPAGVPLRLRPAPDSARARVEMDDPDAEGQLLHGWFPVERVGDRSYRWAGLRAAALVRLDEPAVRMRLDYAHVPADIGGVEVFIRRVGSSEPLAQVWGTRLPWQYIARSVENHPLALPPGDYEVAFSAARVWSNPPLETRSLAFALSSLSFAKSFEVPAGGLEMASPAVEEQLVNGWFEAEESAARRYRWATGRAAAVVRLAEPARSLHLSYCLPPRSIGGLRVALTPLAESGETFSETLAWHDSNWHEQELALELAPGGYLLSFETETTWSNPERRDPELWGENRSLGFALSSLSFSPRR